MNSPTVLLHQCGSASFPLGESHFRRCLPLQKMSQPVCCNKGWKKSCGENEFATWCKVTMSILTCCCSHGEQMTLISQNCILATSVSTTPAVSECFSWRTTMVLVSRFRLTCGKGTGLGKGRETALDNNKTLLEPNPPKLIVKTSFSERNTAFWSHEIGAFCCNTRHEKQSGQNIGIKDTLHFCKIAEKEVRQKFDNHTGWKLEAFLLLTLQVHEMRGSDRTGNNNHHAKRPCWCTARPKSHFSVLSANCLLLTTLFSCSLHFFPAFLKPTQLSNPGVNKCISKMATNLK